MFPMFTRHRGYKTYHSAKPTVITRKRSWPLSFFSKRRDKKINRQRDFWDKPFRNPFFAKNYLPKRTIAPKTKITVGVLCLLGTVSLFIFHPFFNINKIEINDLARISAVDLNNLADEVLNQRRLWLFNGRNFFLANLNKIKNEVEARYVLENFKIQTRFPNRLQMDIKEKAAKLLLQNSLPQINGEAKNFYYALDSEGKIIQAVAENEITNPNFLTLLLIEFQNLNDLKIGQQIISPATVEFLSFLQQKIPEKTKVNLAFGILADEEGMVAHLTTAEGWKIIVDRQNDWEKQLQVLTIFLRDKIKENRKNLRYIDVRYENRSYYQ